jgi:hypothetical protein
MQGVDTNETEQRAKQTFFYLLTGGGGGNIHFFGRANQSKKSIGRNQTMEPLRPLLLGKGKDLYLVGGDGTGERREVGSQARASCNTCF